jgi:thiamine biosynthesis lipoprotein
MKSSARRAATLIAIITGALVSAQGAPTVFVSRDAYVMGTLAQLSTYAAERDLGLATLESALATIEDTEQELSTWRPLSRISDLNRQTLGRPWVATPRLCRMFVDVWSWHRLTDGAFDPAIGQLASAWDIQGEGAVPTSDAVSLALAASGLGLFKLDPDRCTLTRRADAWIDVGGFGKGEALDRLAARLTNHPWMVNLGGQIAVGGRVPPEGVWRIEIADPRHRDRPILQVGILNGSLATSGGSERDNVVHGTRVGHILDPRTGYPATFNGSVTTWHERGLVADILSTALYVMGPEAGLPWAEARGIAACFLIPDRGISRVEMTTNFRRLLPAASVPSG